MSTTESHLLVHAYCDGELDPVNAKAVEQQIAADPRLAAERDRILALRRALHDRVPPRALPTGLRTRVEQSIFPQSGRMIRSWNAFAAAAIAAVVISGVVAWYMLGRSGESLFIRELAGSHARALITARLTDIDSSDQHTIKPWFSTRTSQAPRVVDLASDGFPLVGGRLDVIEKIPVPTLIYRLREHIISLTEMPSSAVAGISIGRHAINGFHVVGWTEDDTSYWATSDIGTADLDLFVRKFRAATLEGRQ